MIVRIFKTNQVYIYAFIPLVLFALRWPVLVHDAPFSPAGQLPFLTQFFAWLSTVPVYSLLLGVICITYQAYVLSELCNEHRLLPFSSNLTAFLLAISYSVFAHHNWFSPVIFSNLFSVLALKRILNIYQQGDIQGNLFRASLYISLASIFYLPASFMMLVIFYDLYTIRTFNWREYVIPLIGFLNPLIYLWAYFFLRQETDIFFNYFIEPKTFLSILNFNFLNWSASLIMLLILLFSLVFLLTTNSKRTVRQNNLFKVISATLFLSILLSILYSKDFMSASALIWPSLSIIVTYFVVQIERSWIREGIMYLLLFSIVARDFVN